MSDLEKFKVQEALINEKAQHLQSVLLNPLLDDSTGEWIPEDQRSFRNSRLMKETPHSVFESLGQSAPMIQATAAYALEDYVKVHGLPSPDLLASACVAIENSIAASTGGEGVGGRYGGGIFEDIGPEMKTTAGVLKRDRQVALILPVMLTSITSNLVSFIPGTFNQSEIFRVDRVAGSTFGDYTAGDILEPKSFSGQYSEMDQRYQVASGDGTEVGGAASTTANYFQFDSNTTFSKVMPFKPKRCVVYYEGDLVARDDGNGNIHGNFTNRSGTAVTVTGTVNYDTGNIDPIFSVAPEAADDPTAGDPAARIHVGFDVDIEKDATLIPLVNHAMQAKTVYPHESALAGEVTLQAYWDLKREFMLDHRSMLMTSQTNVMAASRDRKILRDLYFFSSFNTPYQWSRSVPTGAAYTPTDHYESLRQTLLEIDANMVKNTQISGLVGIVAPTMASTVMMSMKAPNFTPAPGFVSKPQPHYAGKLFGRWDLWIDPYRTDDYTCLCYGKGNSPGLSAYNTGTCIAPITIRHPQGRDLKYSQTMWSMEYRDQNPFDDAKHYLADLELTA